VEREVRVNGGVIDMMTRDGVGIELKPHPVGRGALLRQLRAYIQDDRLRAIIAVAPERVDLPERLHGKRITVVPYRRRDALSA
jgi:hypothetical protein